MYKSGGSKRLERDSPPHVSSKRSRSSLGRYQDPDSGDERSPESSRSRSRHYADYREGGGRGGGYKDPPERRYYGNLESDYRSRAHHSSSSAAAPPVSRPYPYKVLCISSLHTKASDEMVRDTLYREFKRFGDISVKIVNEPDERVAYVYFRSYEDARDAKHSKSRIIIYDKPVMVEAAYESSSSSSNTAPSSTNYRQPEYPPQDVGGGGRYGGSSGGGYSNNRRSPPIYDGGMGGGRGHHREDGHRGIGGGMGGYDRGYHPPPHHHPPGGPGFPPMRHNDYRREGDWGAPPGRQPHMYNNNPRYPPPPGGPGGMRGAPLNMTPAERAAYEQNKKDKFPNYLHHVSPEDDPLATRTLFAGNLEVNITDEEMRRIFGRYGTVEDIDIKRPPPGTGNAYAFVRFANLDMASRAKTELSGQYIGKFQCKIGYGKVNPTTKIWVGGLGPWASMSALEREFDRFGSIKKIDWAKGDIQAFITYETIDAAQAAVKDMRGYPLGGPDKRVRTDFAGVEQIVSYAKKYEDYDQQANYERGNYGGGRRPPRTGSSNVVLTGANEEEVGAPPGSAHSTDIDSPSDSESGRARPSRNGSSAPLSNVKSISDLTSRVSVGWQGGLILKNSSFAAKMYITDGDLDTIEALMTDEVGKKQLRITQRLRLDQSKLDDVNKRMSSSTSHGIFLAMPTSIASPLSPDGQNASPSIQSRPLRNLVSYLKQKEAAGVISLQNRELGSGVLYAFPPCPFSLELLHKSMPALEEPKEDHLVIVVIRGGTA